MKKGISPLIASVLLIAFTLAVAVIITTWISGFTTQQTGTTSQRGEAQAKCIKSVLTIDKDEIAIKRTAGGGPATDNVTLVLTYAGGTENIKITYGTATVSDGTTKTTYSLKDSASGTTFAPGEAKKIYMYFTTGAGTAINVTSGVYLSDVKISGLCRDEFTITGSYTNESV